THERSNGERTRDGRVMAESTVTAEANQDTTTQTATLPAPMYRADDELKPEVETDESASEVQDDKQVQTEDKPESKNQGPTLEQISKGLQKVAQQQTTDRRGYETQVSELKATFAEQFTNLKGLIEGLGNKPAETRVEQVSQDEAQGDLDALIQKFTGENDDIEGVTKAEIREVIAAVAKSRGVNKNDPSVAILTNAVNDLRKKLDETEAKASAADRFLQESEQREKDASDYRIAIDTLNTEHGFDVEPLWKASLTEAQTRYPEYATDTAKLTTAAQLLFDLKLDAKKAEKPNDPPAKPKPTARTSPIGTETTPIGATSGAAKGGKPSRPPMYIED
ncbi:MAG: hypothetical protein Q8P61_05945, partial [Candidatus Nanopelagicales bacterium]|nr:hypothetical protein [Candidatus Nanopelagicales bacterium]